MSQDKAKVNELIVRTPEGCSFALLLAGPITRFLAWLIDALVTMALLIAALMLLAKFLIAGPGLMLAAQFLATFLIWFGYGIALESWWRGRTIGKKFLRLRVMDEQGLRLTFSQVVIRNLLRFADMLPAFYLVGGLTCLFSRRAQRIGDLVAGTVVVRTPKLDPPDLSRAITGKFNSFKAHPHVEARLRQRVSPAEARVALQALLRRDSLEPAGRIRLFRQIAEHFRSVVTFPQTATDSLSDEQYVRNVVDTLYRSQLRS